jgi:phosphate/sulfate permease
VNPGSRTIAKRWIPGLIGATIACVLAIALGTHIGGWRVIRPLGKGLVEIEARQGMAAEGGSAAVILASSQLGFALSTTHVAAGSILGSGGWPLADPHET